MRRIIVKEARPGMCAARAIADSKRPDAPCVATGDVLSMAQIIQMHELGVYELWVNDPGLDFFDDVCSSQPTTAQLRLAEALRDSFLKFSGVMGRGIFRRYEMVLSELMQALTRAAAAVPCFGAMTDDAALLAHSCDTCAVATLLGLQLETYLVEQRRRLNCRQAREILNLSLGALFHDIGELMLPAAQRESQLSSLGLPILVPDAYPQEWKQHTNEGYAAVRGRLDPTAAVVVQHHHQHFDGSGFAGPVEPTLALANALPPAAKPAPTGAPIKPGLRNRKPETNSADRPGQSGEAIHVYTRIATMADVFCHHLHSNGTRVPHPVIKTLWQFQQAPVRQWFDPVVLQAFLAMLPPFAEGMVVTLNDRRQAVVTKLEPNAPCCPQIRILATAGATTGLQMEGTSQGQNAAGAGTGGATGAVGGEVIHLVDCPGVEITAVDGSEIADFLYGTRPGRPMAA